MSASCAQQSMMSCASSGGQLSGHGLRYPRATCGMVERLHGATAEEHVVNDTRGTAAGARKDVVKMWLLPPAAAHMKPAAIVLACVVQSSGVAPCTRSRRTRAGCQAR